jgi:virulence-associated protein VapD
MTLNTKKIEKNNIKNYEQEIRRTLPAQPFASEQGSVGQVG